MRKEVLRSEEHEDGSHTVVEKTTQTPEDGFVEHKVWHGGHTKTMYVKGRVTTVTYQSTEPKVMLRAALLIYPLVMLAFAGVFLLFITLAKEDPKAVAVLKLVLLVVMVFVGWCFFQTVHSIRRKLRESEEKQAGEASEAFESSKAFDGCDDVQSKEDFEQ